MKILFFVKVSDDDDETEPIGNWTRTELQKWQVSFNRGGNGENGGKMIIFFCRIELKFQKDISGSLTENKIML